MSQKPRQEPAPPDVRVHACSPNDRGEQVALFNACFKKPVDERALAWRYDESPHGTSLSFLSRSGKGESLAGYACSPRIALALGDPESQSAIGETGDVMTHPDWRKRGLFSALDRAAMQASKAAGWPIVFGLPNRRSAHIFLELGWREVGKVRPWTFLLGAGSSARAVRASEGRLRRWLAPLHARRCAKARERLEHSVEGWSLRPLESFPAAVEELALRVARRFALMVRRDPAYLSWRFLQAPSGRHRCLGIHARDGAFRGYVVVQPPREGENVGYLVDLLADEEAAVAAGISGALAELEALGARAVRATAIDGSWWRGRLEEAGFLPPKPENHLSVIVHVHDPAHPLAQAALDASRWYLTDGDRDDETMG
ncbi:MAG: GNAT family N-acetyltransferase [Planctomycetes bacterium]|nr:GNAT family N-acetyltransferase [Planctomycetota bacterium]